MFLFSSLDRPPPISAKAWLSSSISVRLPRGRYLSDPAVTLRFASGFFTAISAGLVVIILSWSADTTLRESALIDLAYLEAALKWAYAIFGCFFFCKLATSLTSSRNICGSIKVARFYQLFNSWSCSLIEKRIILYVPTTRYTDTTH